MSFKYALRLSLLAGRWAVLLLVCLLSAPAVAQVRSATPAESLQTLPGFHVELLRSAATNEGSWISLAVDPRGRLLISPQDDRHPLLRLTLTRAGAVQAIERVPAPIRQAMGMCFAHGSLYANAHGPAGTGLYRLTDTNRNDQFDAGEWQFLKSFAGEGEHGYHAVVPGPDGMIYVMNGNHTRVPADLAASSPHRNYDEDLLLPRLWDAGGHAVGILAPGGHILRTDPAGKNWELLLAGFRNAYDFDFDPDGEIFTFDSDMEWDWGLPWYRPTRINHGVSAAEFGWRSGSGKWPEHYADSLPAVVDTGIGSPTGVKFGTNSKFPAPYRRALFALDWSYGRILAIHLRPRGASYTGDYEDFLRGKPLNLTDVEFGKDGAMYFITGGRATQSGLYRVSYRPKKVSPSQATTLTPTAEKVTLNRREVRATRQARELREKLEAFHGQQDPKAVAFAWPHLGSDDRFIRHAARLAIEWQPVEQWAKRALGETNTTVGLTALLALARCGDRETQAALLRAVEKLPVASEDVALEKLRIIQLSFIRQGRPSPEVAAMVIEKLSPLYPAAGERMNRDLAELLLYLNAPDVIGRTLDIMDRAMTQEEQVHYLHHLRTVRTGWTLAQRERYFKWFIKLKESSGTARHPADLKRWFAEAGREYSDGSSYAKYLVNIRQDAIATLTVAERAELQPLLDFSPVAPEWKPTRERSFVKNWTVADLEGRLDDVGTGRNFNSGRAAYNDAQCVQCHRFGNDGGWVGPELTSVASKYSRRDLLESLLDPSKVVSDQYQNYTLLRRDGEEVSGRIIEEDMERIVIMPNMLAPANTVAIPLRDIESRRPDRASPMPAALLDHLSAEEILDLLAYLESVGKSNAPNFRRERRQP